MESRHCFTLGPAGTARNDARAAHVARRLLGRLRAIAIGVVVATLIAAGERWLLVDAPAPGIELGVAVQAADALGWFGAADAVGRICFATGRGGLRPADANGGH